jgi:hypothetical protein
VRYDLGGKDAQITGHGKGNVRITAIASCSLPSVFLAGSSQEATWLMFYKLFVVLRLEKLHLFHF